MTRVEINTKNKTGLYELIIFPNVNSMKLEIIKKMHYKINIYINMKLEVIKLMHFEKKTAI